ncbi:hypothetical protein E2G06_20365 [Salmonella enterica subsp. enterica]|nr:hypothetical protein [Salmonella enterica subsp. enterica serovar Warnow]ECB3807375.1 hypothetical protein [Salmonella enterica subsp. enterica serovar Fufu]ECI7957164.1 hypothetical protein [Salmonella enterica subsp. enterica]MBH0683313.1 hypothetical protein [Salmonella enterica]HAK9055132.1 hypothetical protein [Salmonella enterica]
MIDLEWFIIYFREKVRVIGGWRLIAAGMNVIACIYFIVLACSMKSSSFGYRQDEFAIYTYLIIMQIISFFCLVSSEKPTVRSSNSIISLWIKRKRLENQAKIKELEK